MVGYVGSSSTLHWLCGSGQVPRLSELHGGVNCLDLPHWVLETKIPSGASTELVLKKRQL